VAEAAAGALAGAGGFALVPVVATGDVAGISVLRVLERPGLFRAVTTSFVKS
jgi:hypothetical protein